MKFKDSRTTRLPWEVHNMMDILLKSFWCTKDYLKFHYHMKALEDYFPNAHNSFRVCLKLADIGVKRTWRGRPGQGATAVADIWEVILASYWDHPGQIHLEGAVSNEQRTIFGMLCFCYVFHFGMGEGYAPSHSPSPLSKVQAAQGQSLHFCSGGRGNGRGQLSSLR